MIEPYYQEDGITLYCGDCREILPQFKDKEFDLVLTDPPYNELNQRPNFGGWSIRNVNKGEADSLPTEIEFLSNEFVRVSSGAIYVWCGFEQFSSWIKAYRENNLLARCGRWEKPNPSPLNGQYTWLSDVELCAFAHQKNATFNNFCNSASWKIPSHITTEHPTEKPLALFKAICNVSSNKEQRVLDPFCGSGTTLVAAKQLGRRAVGIEIFEKYCEIAVKRLAQMQLEFA